MKRTAGILLTGLLVALLGAGLTLRAAPPSADALARDVQNALERQDVDRLLALAFPGEAEKLHMTPANVRAFLNETLYSKGGVTFDRVTRQNQGQPDEVQYTLFTPSLPRPMHLLLNQTPQGRWYLALGISLAWAASAPHPQEGNQVDGRRVAQMRLKYGIIGSRTNAEGWIFYPQKPGDAYRFEPMVWE